MKYLFWNTHKNKRINSVLCDLIIENSISIVVLAEYTADMNELIEFVHSRGVSMQQFPTIGCDRIYILGETGINIEPQLQTDHSSIQVIDSNTMRIVAFAERAGGLEGAALHRGRSTQQPRRAHGTGTVYKCALTGKPPAPPRFPAPLVG